ncbi:Circadian-associated transcriptional repressor [Bagarius yarrelli]|uniref:Circadian-associated transcriptional repressor n=1 Tax=Bagarius yarrelli TaxID=175774 RepID=A0A556U451_BAGYA|nr:Circadian-associated transcriptional repressor [Bagarius yarrelli]
MRHVFNPIQKKPRTAVRHVSSCFIHSFTAKNINDHSLRLRAAQHVHVAWGAVTRASQSQLRITEKHEAERRAADRVRDVPSETKESAPIPYILKKRPVMKQPRMSASDSDYSIDWLASDDDEKDDSELETDCDREQDIQSTTSAAQNSCSPQTCRRNSDHSVKDKDDRSCRGSPPSSPTSSFTGDTSPPGQKDMSSHSCTLGGTKGKTRRAQKRSQCLPVAEQNEKPLTARQTEKDKLFAYKCMELQCYIHPLSSILNGLRSGRYRERLSTFQESVAMDRIQRIMGVLRNPCMGERYIDIILKMEEMLKTWFPNIKPSQQTTAMELTQEITLLKKPKVRLSLNPAPISAGLPRSGSPGASPVAAKAIRGSDLILPSPYSATNLKWLHTSPICSPTAEQGQRTIRNLLTACRDEDATQDNSVSSTIDTPEFNMDSVPCPPPPGKISAPCLERLLKSTESIIDHKSSRGTSNMSSGNLS